MPPNDELIRDLSRRLAPHLQEMGFVGFVLIGYIEPAPGEPLRRVTLGADMNNPAISDGLRKLACVWGAGMSQPQNQGFPG